MYSFPVHTASSASIIFHRCLCLLKRLFSFRLHTVFAGFCTVNFVSHNRYRIWQSYSHLFPSRSYKFYFGYSYAGILFFFIQSVAAPSSLWKNHIFSFCVCRFSMAITLKTERRIVKRCQFLHLFEWLFFSHGFSFISIRHRCSNKAPLKWQYFYDFAVDEWKQKKNSNKRVFLSHRFADERKNDWNKTDATHIHVFIDKIWLKKFFCILLFAPFIVLFCRLDFAVGSAIIWHITANSC